MNGSWVIMEVNGSNKCFSCFNGDLMDAYITLTIVWR